MVIGVITVNVMQPTIVDEIDMGTVLHAHVLLARMAVGMIVARNAPAQFLSLGVGGADVQRVFVDMPVMAVMQMTVVEIIDMSSMFERLMAASRAMSVAFMPGVQHLVRGKRCGSKGKRQRGAQQGSVHQCPPINQRSRFAHTPISVCRRAEN